MAKGKAKREERWSSPFRQPPMVFKWFAAPVYTASFAFGNVLQYDSSGVRSARP